MLHWSVSWSIFLLYSTFLRPLVDVLFWGNRLGRKGTAIFYLLLWCEKGAWDALRWKGWNQQEKFHPFFFKLLNRSSFFRAKRNPASSNDFCVCAHISSLLVWRCPISTKAFVCNFASYLSVNIYSSSTFSYVSVSWWYPTLYPLQK